MGDYSLSKESLRSGVERGKLKVLVRWTHGVNHLSEGVEVGTQCIHILLVYLHILGSGVNLASVVTRPNPSVCHSKR